MKKLFFSAIKRIPQLIAAFLIYDMARVFNYALFDGGIIPQLKWSDYSIFQIFREWGGGYFGDYIWILAIELFVYIPIGFYWIFHDDIKRIITFVKTKGENASV